MNYLFGLLIFNVCLFLFFFFFLEKKKKKKYLDVSGNNFTSLDVPVHQGPSCLNVASLNVSYNSLRSFPYAFVSQFCSLTALDASHNSFTEMPHEILRELPQLTQLDMSYNQLQQISALDQNAHAKLANPTCPSQCHYERI